MPARPAAVVAAAAHDVGLMMAAPAAVAVPTLGIALVCGEAAAAWGVGLVLLVGAVGLVVARLTRGRRGDARPDHQTLIALAWLLAAVVCAAPFLAAATLDPEPTKTTAGFADPVNALFESMSGLTSTGLSVASDPAELPRSLQWWRSTTQWLGGVGILYLILSLLGPRGRSGGDDREEDDQNQAVGDENDEGEDSDDPASMRRALPRTWLVYALLTLATALAMWLGGMPLWDAANHAQAAAATGGFSIRSDSLTSYPPAAQAAAVGAMVVGSLSFFTLRRVVLYGSLATLARDRQARWLAALLAGGFALLLVIAPGAGSTWEIAFQWASALCTCGFNTVPTGGLPVAFLALMVPAMLVGGSAGSTTGGLKLARLRRVLWAALGRGSPDPAVSEPARRTLRVVLAFAAAYALGVALLWLTAGRPPLGEAAFEAASALGTVGLSTGLTSADLPATARLVLAALMWVGRLEVLAVASAAAALFAAAKG